MNLLLAAKRVEAASIGRKLDLSRTDLGPLPIGPIMRALADDEKTGSSHPIALILTLAQADAAQAEYDGNAPRYSSPQAHPRLTQIRGIPVQAVA